MEAILGESIWVNLWVAPAYSCLPAMEVWAVLSTFSVSWVQGLLVKVGGRRFAWVVDLTLS